MFTIMKENEELLESIKKLKERIGKEYVEYYRMYFRDECWGGSWFDVDSPLTPEESNAVKSIVDEIVEVMPNGMNDNAIESIQSNYHAALNHRYHLFAGDNILVQFATEYGNEDYSVRIYLYR